MKIKMSHYSSLKKLSPPFVLVKEPDSLTGSACMHPYIHGAHASPVVQGEMSSSSVHTFTFSQQYLCKYWHWSPSMDVERCHVSTAAQKGQTDLNIKFRHSTGSAMWIWIGQVIYWTGQLLFSCWSIMRRDDWRQHQSVICVVYKTEATCA